jgi:hypothetical protein
MRKRASKLTLSRETLRAANMPLVEETIFREDIPGY